MALHTKVGGRETNSYITIAEADTILASEAIVVEDDAVWVALSLGEKEYRLLQAFNFMDMLPFVGSRIYVGQAASFPRSFQSTYGLGPKVIPEVVKESQAQIAFSVIHRALIERPAVSEGIGGTRVSRISLGGLLSASFVKKSTEGASSFDVFLKTIHWPIYSKLLPYLTSIRGGAVINLVEEPTLSTTTTTTSTTSTTTTTSTSTTTTTTT